MRFVCLGSENVMAYIDKKREVTRCTYVQKVYKHLPKVVGILMPSSSELF